MSLAKKIGYASESLTDFVSDVINGEEIAAPKEVVENRRAICEKCDQQKTIAKMKYCAECGCSINVKTKGASFSCPLQKWKKHN